MKIIVLHGEDTEKIYLRLKKFIETAKSRSWEVVYLDESPLSIQESLSAVSLFDSERFFVLKDIKKFGKKEFEWLNKKYKGLAGNLIIYHEGILSATFLKSLPNDSTIEEFKLPKILWTFLEHVYPGNSEKVLREFHQIIERDAPEFLFSLIARQLKDVYWVKVDPRSTGFADWKISKLKYQADKFSEEKLKTFIGRLAEIDVEVKTSKTDLVSALDLVIIKQLE